MFCGSTHKFGWSSESPVSADVARGVYFAPKLVDLANGIIDSMSLKNAKVFNSIHLRIEQDARDWTTIMGGKEVANTYSRIILFYNGRWLSGNSAAVY